MKPRRSFVLSTALAIAHTSGALALAPSAIGRAQSLMAADDDFGAETEGGVALLHIRGPISQRTTEHMCGVSLGYDAITAAFGRLCANEDVTAIVMVIDSPGGDVAGLFTAVRTMQAAKTKPVYAFADEMACSAAYALACVADAIYLPSTGEIGSIGILTIHEDVSGAAAAAGVVHTIIRSGTRKAEGNPLEPLSDATKAVMQTRIDGLAEEFFSLVVPARGLSVDRVKGLQGASLMGSEAVAAGLADGLATLGDVIQMAAVAAAGEAPMTAEEKKEMEALQAKLDAAEKRVAELEAAEGEPEPEPKPADDAPSEEPEEPEDAATAARAENARLRAELARRDIIAAVDAGAREGKIEPARRADMIAVGEKIGLASLKTVIAAMSPARLKAPIAKPAPTGVAPRIELSAIEQAVAKQMGISPEAFAAAKAKNTQTGEEV